MDFSQQYFGTSQPYHFTPTDEYNSQPTPIFDGFPSAEAGHAFPQNYQQYAQFNHQNQSSQAQQQPPHFPSHVGVPARPPTPPSHNGHSQSNGSPPSVHDGSVHPDNISTTKSDPEVRRAGSNSDDDDMTPAQSRRKAQNRAAQRAFRERKEQHVKTLEAKLATLEAEQGATADENERLKRDIQRMNTENEVLRATNQAHAQQGGILSPPAPTQTGPLQYNPTDFYSDLLANHNNKTPSHRVTQSEAGERLMAAGATWDMIINHELFKRGLVDVGRVSDILKSQARCDGQGPVFEERAIISAIELSVASGSDELI